MTQNDWDVSPFHVQFVPFRVVGPVNVESGVPVYTLKDVSFGKYADKSKVIGSLTDCFVRISTFPLVTIGAFRTAKS
ncbi:hypothetical protein D3C81_2183090 [compost metagenome]